MRMLLPQTIAELDPWQQEVVKTSGNMVLRSGRQVGKSTVIGMKAAKYALEHPNKLIMIISKTERQAGLLFMKILFYVNLLGKTHILKGKDRPTKHKLSLKNGSTIHSLPAGDTGYGIMGFTIDLLIADEAAFIPEEVWNSIIPALAITRGEIWLLSTPFVKEGYYYQCFSDPTFTSFHTSAEDSPRKDQVFLDRQKEVLTKAQYAQMYLGQFVDEIKQFFPDELIARTCVGKRREPPVLKGEYYLGCDVARMDRDEFTFEIVEIRPINQYYQIESIQTLSVPIPDSVRKIKALDSLYNFRRIYVDSGGMGIAVCDMLRDYAKTKRKVVEINNVSRVYDRNDRKKKVMKEQLYNNLKRLMETNRITLLDDDEVKASLKSIQAEHHKVTGRMSINGSYSHIVEGLIRAVWCEKEKGLKLWALWS